MTLVTACGGGSRVRYGDSKAVETVNEGYGSTDLQMVVSKMCQSLSTHPASEGRPYITLRAVENRSGEYIDTQAITGKIRTALLQSGRFRFTTEKRQLKEALEDVEMQQDTGLYKKEGAAKKGNWQPPQYRLWGRISAIRKSNEDVKDVFFRFEMNLDEIDSATTVWSAEKEIRKVVDR